MSIITKLFKIMFLLAIVGAIYQYFGTQSDERAFQPVGTMIDVGGYRLHMIDSQVAKTTVVIDSSAGQKTIDWCLVQPEIAKFARVITYDRAGYAWSDASPLERTSENIVQELHTMLHNAKIPAPYILVGHGFGGMNVRLFASQYPDEVAGVILVDAGHEDLFEKIPQLRPNLFMLYAVCAGNYIGVFRILNLFAATQQKVQAAIGTYPAFLQRMYFPLSLTTKYINAMTQEALFLEKSCQQLKAAGGVLGDKPLMVISSGQQMAYERIAGYIIPGQVDQYDAAWSQLQADLLTNSTRGKQMIAARSPYAVSTHQPNVIIDAVREMAQALRTGN